MTQAIAPIVLAFAAGCSVVVQQIINANLRAELNSVFWSGTASYVVGLACMMAMVLATLDPMPSASTIARVPWWAWSGGAFGAFFIAISIIVTRELGAATLIALLVAGQLIAAIVIDHIGLLGVPQKPIDLARVGGALLLIAGVILIRR